MESDDDDHLERDFDVGSCFPIQEAGFSFKKSFMKMNNKKLSGTIDFRLKTGVTKALLKDNACDDRKLRRVVGVLDHHKDQVCHKQNLLKLSFRFSQAKKKDSWDRDDRYSVDRLNLPHLRSGDRKLLSASLQQVYRVPGSTEKVGMNFPLSPVAHGEVEPRIVEYRNHTYLTKQPIVHEINAKHIKRYDRYRGIDFLKNRSVLDDRFQRLSTALSEVKREVRPVRGGNYSRIKLMEQVQFNHTRVTTIMDPG